MDETRKHLIRNNLQTILTSLEILNDPADPSGSPGSCLSASELEEISAIIKNMMACVQRINEAIEATRSTPRS